MKNVNYITSVSITVALITFLSLLVGILVNILTGTTRNISWLLTFSVILVLVSLGLGILVIISTVREKQASKPDENKGTIVSKDITIRFNLGEGPVTIDVPDIKSAVEVLQGIQENLMKSENHLKAESRGTMEQTKPETPDVPDTKETEK
jgi:uncharacterized protein YhhL (DUF1145 family)